METLEWLDVCQELYKLTHSSFLFNLKSDIHCDYLFIAGNCLLVKYKKGVKMTSLRTGKIFKFLNKLSAITDFTLNLKLDIEV